MKKNGISVDAVPSSGKNAFDFIISNETNDYIECTLDAVTINDFTGEELSYALIYEMVFSGCQCRFTIQPKEGFLKDCGITQVERIEFRLNIEVNGDYRNEYFTDMMEYNILSGKMIVRKWIYWKRRSFKDGYLF